MLSKVRDLTKLPSLSDLPEWELNMPPAALQRVPEIKPSDVQEVFFGNVISAG
jgi:hypothetical protein